MLQVERGRIIRIDALEITDAILEKIWTKHHVESDEVDEAVLLGSAAHPSRA